MIARQWYGSRLSVILESIFIGFIVGFVISAFRYLLSRAESFRLRFYELLTAKPWYWTAGWAVLLALTGLFLGWAAKVRPMVKGSGIPQVKGALARQMSMDWAPELPLKLITAILGLSAGLSLGREGPSIFIGAYVGLGVLSFLRRPYGERKILVTAAAAAGVSAAFNAPLAGVLFVLEELLPSFSPLFIACSMGASAAADAVAGYFFGMKPIFNFRDIMVLPLSFIHWIILLGALCALLGDLFKRFLYASQNIYESLRIPPILRPVLPLLVSIPLGFYLFDVTGGGHSLIEFLPKTQWTLAMVLFLLAAKMFFTALCYGSGTSGGIFLPLLACGALAGDALGKILVRSGFVTEPQVFNFMILGMAAFFAGVVKAPVTGIVLILEMSGSFRHLGTLVLVSMVSFVTTDLIGSRPVYTVLLERMLRSRQPRNTDPYKGTSETNRVL
jgi:H+/Cl- antiporter ClcA